MSKDLAGVEQWTCYLKPTNVYVSRPYYKQFQGVSDLCLRSLLTDDMPRLQCGRSLGLT